MSPTTAHALVFLLATVAGAVGVGYHAGGALSLDHRRTRLWGCLVILALGLIGFLTLALR